MKSRTYMCILRSRTLLMNPDVSLYRSVHFDKLLTQGCALLFCLLFIMAATCSMQAQKFDIGSQTYLKVPAGIYFGINQMPVNVLNNGIVNNEGTIAITSSGDWTNNGQSAVGNGLVIFAGSSAQTINGVTTFGDLEINNPAGVTMTDSNKVKNILWPSLGTLSTGGKLTLLSSAQQTALIAGSGSGEVTGNVTMQRYLPVRRGYHYMASPFNGASIHQFDDELGNNLITGNPYIGGDTTQTVTPFPNFYIYDETQGPTMAIGWVGASSTLETMKGYCVNYGATTLALTTDVTGVVNNGPLSVNVTKTITGNTYADGWNFIGNPYPSPIDWDAAGWTKTNVNDGIYYFKANTQYTGTYCTYVNGIGVPGTTTGKIPSMQGFFVKATAGGTLGVTNAVRTLDLAPVFYKAAVSVPLLRLKGYPTAIDAAADETVIYFDPLATAMFDGNLDAYKMMNNDLTYPNIFTRDSSVYSLSINALPPLMDTDVVIPFGFITKTSGSFTIEAKEILNFDPSLNIYLEDNQTSTLQDLTINPLYTFSITANAPLYRFFIRFSAAVITDVGDNGSSFVDAWSAGNYVYVNFSSSATQNAVISVYNMLGQVVISQGQEGFGTSRFRIEKAGCYIVNVVSGSDTYQKKVVVM